MRAIRKRMIRLGSVSVASVSTGGGRAFHVVNESAELRQHLAAAGVIDEHAGRHWSVRLEDLHQPPFSHRVCRYRFGIWASPTPSIAAPSMVTKSFAINGKPGSEYTFAKVHPDTPF